MGDLVGFVWVTNECTDLHFHQQYTNDLSQHPCPHWLLFTLVMRKAVFHQVENYTDLNLFFKNVETRGGSPSSERKLETWDHICCYGAFGANRNAVKKGRSDLEQEEYQRRLGKVRKEIDRIDGEIGRAHV